MSGSPISIRMVLLGKTGAGKSSLGNTILGESLFKINHTSYHDRSKDLLVTMTRQVHERNITLTDTPGFFDNKMTEEGMKAVIAKCITDCSPGPHVFLILLKVEKFTEKEDEVISQIQELFSEEAFKYAVVVFTHGDQLDDDIKIEDFVGENEKLHDLLQKCGGRCHVVDNKYWKNQQDGYRSNQVQVEALLNTIDRMIETNVGGYYTNEMLQEVESSIRIEARKIRTEPAQDVSAGASGRHTGSEESDKADSVAGVKKNTGFFLAPHRRIVLLGQTGVGKSSLANTILGQSLFQTYHGAVFGECQTVTSDIHGRHITLTDTPGFFDSKKSEEEMKSAITKCITDCSPGPHAFLIMLKVERFTDQENEVISKIKKSFSEEAFKHAVVVFTYGDQLPVNMKIEEFVSQNKKLRDLLRKCGDRYHVVDNKYWNNQQDEYRNNQVQVAALLNTIDKLVTENQGAYYTNNFFQFVERRIREEEINIRQTLANRPDVHMSDQEIRDQAKKKVRDDIKKVLAGVSVGVLLGALLGVPLMVACVLKALVRPGPAVRTVVKAARAGGAAAARAAARAAAGAGVGAQAGPGAASAAGGATGVVGAAVGAAEAVEAEAAGAAAEAGAGAAGTAAFIGAGVGVGIATVAGAVIGGRTGYEEARKADSVKEAIENTAGALFDKIAEPFREMREMSLQNQEEEVPLLEVPRHSHAS